MIFNCTDHDTRTKHYNDWIDYYYSELDRSLSDFGLKSNFVYPRDQLDADLKRYGKLYFGLSLVLAGVITIKSEEASIMRDAMETASIAEITENMSISSLHNDTVVRFRTRIIDLIKSFRQFGLL